MYLEARQQFLLPSPFSVQINRQLNLPMTLNHSPLKNCKGWHLLKQSVSSENKNIWIAILQEILISKLKK